MQRTNPPPKKRISIPSAKAKGRQLQNWTCIQISRLLGLEWGKDEQIAPREMGQTGTDVRLVADAKELFPWSVECKWQEQWSIHEFIKQAKENRKKGTDWLLVLRRSRQEPVVVLEAEVFFGLLRLVRGAKKGR